MPSFGENREATLPLTESPWLHQLTGLRPILPLHHNTKTDVVIVGGGIAGVATAYFILRSTRKKVVLIEKDEIAHGATGHNAGQVVSYFERQLSDLVREYGLSEAIKAQAAMYDAWDLLLDMHTRTQATATLSVCTGHAGVRDIGQLEVHLENRRLEREGGLRTETIMVANHLDRLADLQARYGGLFAAVPHAQVLNALETNNPAYIAAVGSKKGCLNSALFSEEVIGYLLGKYPRRFQLFEHTNMDRIVLGAGTGVVHANSHTIEAKKIVLCTNGFEFFSIQNTNGDDIDAKFHAKVYGVVGYMAGYLQPQGLPPTAISYLPDTQNTSDPYFYLTRRPYDHKTHGKHTLICVGGPELRLDEAVSYVRGKHAYPMHAQEQIDQFLHTDHAHIPQEPINYLFRWHGLMGYTANGLRLVGPEPVNPVLMYNLGCNGVGILPSIFGGARIARMLRRGNVIPMIFDP